MLTRKLFIFTAFIATLSAHARDYTEFDVTCELRNNQHVIDSFSDSSFGIYENSTSQFVNKLTDTNGSVYMVQVLKLAEITKGLFSRVKGRI